MYRWNCCDPNVTAHKPWHVLLCLSRCHGEHCQKFLQLEVYRANARVFVGCHLARFVLTKSIHCRLLFFAWGRSSPAKGILWRTIPLLISGVFEHPPTTHLFDIFPVFPSMYSVTKTRRESKQHCVPGLTSHSEPVLISVHSSKFGRSAKKRYFRYV